MAQCTPSRVSLLTGQYPFRSGWINHWDVPRWGVAYFDWERYTTFARVLETDPWEGRNLLNGSSTPPPAVLEMFQRILTEMPRTDAWPRYRPRDPNPWDREPSSARTCETP